MGLRTEFREYHLENQPPSGKVTNQCCLFRRMAGKKMLFKFLIKQDGCPSSRLMPGEAHVQADPGRMLLCCRR